MPEWLLFWMLGTVASGFAYWCGWDHRGDWDSRQRDENYDAMRAENKRLRAATDARLDGGQDADQ